MTTTPQRELTDLPGVAGGKLMAGIVKRSTPNVVMRGLLNHRAIAVSGEHGSITVWLDDAGDWRCDFGRFRRSVHHAILTNKLEVRAWLDLWFPKLSEPSP